MARAARCVVRDPLELRCGEAGQCGSSQGLGLQRPFRRGLDARLECRGDGCLPVI